MEAKKEIMVINKDKNKNKDFTEISSEELSKLLNWEITCIELNPETECWLREDLSQKLNEKVVWQDEAKEALLDAIIDSIWSIRRKKWPLGVFFFAWPSWVWKTQIARTLWEVLLWSEDFITKIECEWYSQDHAINNLFWSPKSYVWYWEATPLNDINLFKPYREGKERWSLHPQIWYLQNFSILVFDEIEKAHPKIHQWLLSAMSDWIIKFPSWKETDNKLKFSNTTNLSNTIIIFTSNIWNSEAESRNIWFLEQNWSQEEKSMTYSDKFKKNFSHEFIWRVDKFIPFKSLTKDEVAEIIKNEIIDIDWHFWILEWNVSLKVEEEVITDIVEKSFSTKYWARPSIVYLRNTIERWINRIINSWQLEQVFLLDDDKWFEIVVGKKWDNITYKLMLSESKNITKEELEKEIRKYIIRWINTENKDLEEQINKSMIKFENEFNPDIIKRADFFYWICAMCIQSYSTINDIQDYSWIHLSSNSDKFLFEWVHRRTIKNIIERKIKNYSWEKNYSKKEFQELIKWIFIIIDDLLWLERMNLNQIKEVFKRIDYSVKML